MWGGKGCDKTVDTPASAPYCYPGGVFDPAPHQAGGETQPLATDYLIGGIGGTSTASVQGATAPTSWTGGRAAPTPPVPAAPTTPGPADLNSAGKKAPPTTVDPCSWFEMTNLTNDLRCRPAGSRE